MKTSFGQVISAVAAGLVLGFALVFAISQFIWLSTQSAFVYSRDYDSHLASNSVVHHAKANPSLIWKFYRESNQPFTHHPPLGYLVNYAFTSILGFHSSALYAASLFWWCALFAIVFLLGRLVAQSYLGGALACALFALNPNLAITAYSVNLELPLTVMVGSASFFVLKSQGFTERKFAILAGIFCGLAFITKPASLFYLGPLCLGAFISKRVEFTPKSFNLLSATVLGLVIALSFYAPLLDLLPTDTGRHFDFSFELLRHNLFTNGGFLWELTSSAELILYLISFLFLLYKKDKLLIPIFFWSIGSFFVLLFNHFHAPSYLFPTYLGLSLIGVRALFQLELNQKYKNISYSLALIVTVVFAMNLRAEMFGKKIYWTPDNIPKVFRTLRGFDGKYRFFPDLQSLAYDKAIFTEEKNAVRVILNTRYADIPAPNITLLSLHVGELTIYEKWVWTAFAFDRPWLLNWNKFTAQKRALAVWEKSEFINSIKEAELIVWMGISCPDKVEILHDIQCPVDKLSFSEELNLSEQERKNAQANLKLLNDCTIKEGEYTFWRGDKVCFLKPKAGCF